MPDIRVTEDEISTPEQLALLRQAQALQGLRGPIGQPTRGPGEQRLFEQDLAQRQEQALARQAPQIGAATPAPQIGQPAPQQPPQQMRQPSPPPMPQQGRQNYGQAAFEGFGAGVQGMSVPQMRFMQGQVQLQQFEIQQKMRVQRAEQNIQNFKQKMPAVGKHAKDILRQRQEEAKRLDQPIPQMTIDILDEASQRYDALANPGMQVNEVDQDTMTLTGAGRQYMAELGILPYEELTKVNSQAQQAINAQYQAITKQMQESLQVGNLFDRINPQGPQPNGQPLSPELIANERLGALAQQRGVSPERLAAQLTNAPIRNEIDPQTGQVQGQSIGRIPADLSTTGFRRSKAPMLDQLTKQEETGALGMAGLPAELAKMGEQEAAKARLEAQQASSREKQAAVKSSETIKQIQARGEVSKALESQKTTTRTSLMRLQADLNNDRDRAKGQESMERLKYQIANRADKAPLTIEDKTALALLNGMMAGKRVDANNAAKAARQLAALGQSDEKTVLTALIKSGGVNAADMMEAAKRADKESELNPEKAGSLTHAVFTALQDIASERSLDPFTDDIDFALGAKGKPEKVGELTRLINRWETQAERAKNPEDKATWKKGIEKAEAAMQRLDSSTGSAKDRGNTVFDAASQAVKDILLSKPGDKMHNATWKDVADAHRQVHLDRIEVQVGAMTAKKDQEVIRSAGEIFGLIDAFKDLGQSLFTDSEFLRLSGIQGAKQTFEAFRQKDPRVKEYLRLREGLAGHLSRIGGERGMMTEGDIERAKNFVPDPTAFVPDSLETFNNMMGNFEEFVANKVRGRFDERATSALLSGSTSDRQVSGDVGDILKEAKRRQGIE